MKAIAFGVAGLGVVIIAAAPSPNPLQHADHDVRVIATWNAIALQTTAAGPFSPPMETRALAMQSIAVFDAVNAITRQYQPFAQRLTAERAASIPAAVSAASYRVLSALYPASESTLKASYDSLLTRVAAGSARDAGVAVGEASARRILENRTTDRASQRTAYKTGTGVGAWVKTPPAFAEELEPHWGKVTPFALDSGSQFRPTPPPPPGSDEYERDYAEVMTSGVERSTTRTALQTEVARFWMTTAAQLWNQVVRQQTIDRKFDVTSAARAYLLMNVAGADAMIAAWDAKYFYGQWRPVTAIRSADEDGSSATHTDTGWSPLLATPPFPDYPAGHTSYGGAAEHVLIAIFGEKPVGLSITSPTAAGATHRYVSFTEIAEEVVNARVWAGVHWRKSSTAGRDLGRAVGAHVLSRAPR